MSKKPQANEAPFSEDPRQRETEGAEHGMGLEPEEVPRLLSLEELESFGATEWTRLIADVLQRASNAIIEVGAAKGDDPVYRLAASVSLMRKDSRFKAARVLERLLVDVCSDADFVSVDDSRRIRDILALLAASAISEGCDALAAFAIDQSRPHELRVQAADLLVGVGFRLPAELVEEANSSDTSGLIGPVAEEILKRDAAECLAFLAQAQTGENRSVYIEYPLRKAMKQLGSKESLAAWQRDQPRWRPAFSELFREVAELEFGEWDPKVVGAPDGRDLLTRIHLTARQQGVVEGTVSKTYSDAYERKLRIIAAFSNELVPPVEDELRSAVVTNLKAGVRYVFYVSRSNTSKITSYLDAWWQRVGEDLRASCEHLVTVHPKKADFNANTSLFYLFGEPVDKSLGLVGSQRGVALSTIWEVLSDRVAEMMFAAMGEDVHADAELALIQQKLATSPGDPMPGDLSAEQKLLELAVLATEAVN